MLHFLYFRNQSFFIRLFTALLLMTGISLSAADSARTVQKTDAEKSASAKTPVYQTPPPMADNEYISISNFLTAVQLIHTTYVDPEKASYSKLFEAAIRGMLKELDPYSAYESQEQYKKTVENTQGEYAGIGITVNHSQGVCKIISILPDSPADRAGLAVGDVITAVNGSALDLSTPYPIQQIRGPKGSTVNLTIYRTSLNSMKEFKVTRDTVNFNTVDHVMVCREHPEIGYFQILQFSKDTAEETAKAMKELLQQKVQAVIIDLRENPGGLLNAAVEVCSMFIPEGETIVSVEGRQKQDNKTFKALKNQEFVQIPLLLLVNHNSASCAEIMAGCFQDHKRALILGTKTFGKASIQTLFPDRQNGTALRITTARYYTPNAQAISGKGITPDLEVKLSDNIRHTVLNRLRVAGPSAQATLPEQERDVQYLQAVNTLYGILWQNRKKTDAVSGSVQVQPKQNTASPKNEGNISESK